MTSHVAENEWCVITHHPDEAVLELEWLPDGPEMDDGGFMASLSLLAIVAERVLPPAILIDATAFRHPLGDAVMAWRASSIVPRYGGAGVRKFALVLPEGAPPIGSEAVEENAVFTTAWFGNRADALAWLA